MTDGWSTWIPATPPRTDEGRLTGRRITRASLGNDLIDIPLWHLHARPMTWSALMCLFSLSHNKLLCERHIDRWEDDGGA